MVAVANRVAPISYRDNLYSSALAEFLLFWGLDLVGSGHAAAPDLSDLLDQLDLTRSPSFVEPGFGRAVETQEAEPSLPITLGKIGPGAKDAIAALKAVPEDNLYKYFAEEALEKITAQ